MRGESEINKLDHKMKATMEEFPFLCVEQDILIQTVPFVYPDTAAQHTNINTKHPYP